MDGTPLANAATAEPAVDGESRIGEVLDRRYRIDALIGEGGMAHVYRITHTMIGKSLAAKVVRHELRDDDEVIRRFLREAQIVSSIKHPNVVDISDYGEMPEGGAFCVMELLRGKTLADVIDDGGALDPADALGVALQVCQGLQQSHEAGVVHRDLKPQNIFLCDPKPGKQEPVVKLIDFGVARAGNRITVAGAVLGTPEYMSPEQVRGESVDAGADLYALGIILFELLTAAVPYRSDDVAITMQSQLHAATPKMTAVDPELGDLVETQALIERLMAKDRAERPGTAAEAAILLQRAMSADLGQETAERVVRSTLAIGSGGIVKTPAIPPAPAQPWSDGQMAWNPDQPSMGQPQAQRLPVREVDDTDVEPPPTKSRSLPWVVAATAILASGLTVGGYAATGGFEREAAPDRAAPAVEVVSAPVPPAEDEHAPEIAAPGAAPAPSEVAPGDKAKPEPGGEQTAGQGASVPSGGAGHDSEISNPGTARQGTAPAPARASKGDRGGRRKAARPRKSNAGATAPAAPAAKPPSSPAKPPPAPPPADPPKPQSTHDGDLRNPFG